MESRNKDHYHTEIIPCYQIQYSFANTGISPENLPEWRQTTTVAPLADLEFSKADDAVEKHRLRDILDVYEPHLPVPTAETIIFGVFAQRHPLITAAMAIKL